MLVFRLAEGQEELEATYRLRYEVYCLERNYLPPEQFPHGLEHDEFDEHSVHFVAYEENCHKELLGCFRLILPNRHGLPIHTHFSLHDPSSELGRTVEMSRLIVAPSSRSITHHVFMGLMKQVYIYSKEHEIGQRHAVLDERLLRFLTRLGLPFREIGLSKFFLGGDCVPVTTSAKAFDELLPARNAWLYDYLQAPADEQPLWF